MNQQQPQAHPARPRYQAPKIQSSRLTSITAFQGGCDCGFDCFGKFRRPQR